MVVSLQLLFGSTQSGAMYTAMSLAKSCAQRHQFCNCCNVVGVCVHDCSLQVLVAYQT